MTTDELKKEAEEKYCEVDREFIACQDEGEVFNIGYVLGAEPREKQIAELKESNKMLEQGYVWHDYDAGEDCYEDTHEGKWVKRDEVYQLTKAKEIIREFMKYEINEYDGSLEIHFEELKKQAEQFLKDCEVEK